MTLHLHLDTHHNIHSQRVPRSTPANHKGRIHGAHQIGKACVHQSNAITKLTAILSAINAAKEVCAAVLAPKDQVKRHRCMLSAWRFAALQAAFGLPTAHKFRIGRRFWDFFSIAGQFSWRVSAGECADRGRAGSDSLPVGLSVYHPKRSRSRRN